MTMYKIYCYIIVYFLIKDKLISNYIILICIFKGVYRYHCVNNGLSEGSSTNFFHSGLQPSVVNLFHIFILLGSHFRIMKLFVHCPRCSGDEQ